MVIAELAAELRKSERIAVVAHVSPDGDTLGSALAMQHALAGLGKQAAVVCEDLPPKMYAFLPGVERVVTPDLLPFAPDCALLVDIAAADRAGSALELTKAAKSRLLLDHHATTAGFDGLSVIREHASSTGELVLELLDALGVPIDSEIAVLLYVAIATDTGNFSFDYTTPEAFDAVARCLRAGLDIDTYNRKLFRLRSVPRTRLIGVGLSRMQLAAGGRIAYILLPADVFAQCDAQQEDTEGLVNYLSDMEGVEACFLATERMDSVKISLRSRGRVDVSQIAQNMGGGGHVCAAGATLPLSLDGAALRVLDTLIRALDAD